MMLKMQIANAPCSWGALEFDLEGDAPAYQRVIDEIKETGYTGTELGDWGFMPTDPKVLTKELHARGLNLVGAFVPVGFKETTNHAAGVKSALRVARLLAAVEGSTPFIILADDNGKDPLRTQNAGRILPEMGLTDGQWQTFAEGVTKTAESVRSDTGLRCVFHHHCAGYVETPAEVDRLLALTDPNLIGLCLDTGHYCFGGGNPVACLKQYTTRIWHFHFKDFSKEVAQKVACSGQDYFAAVKAGIFCELGKGAVDFKSAMAVLAESGYNGWGVVEQDVLPGMGSPKASAERNRVFLRSLGL
jgi:inosose dehydratase